MALTRGDWLTVVAFAVVGFLLAAYVFGAGLGAGLAAAWVGGSGGLLRVWFTRQSWR